MNELLGDKIVVVLVIVNWSVNPLRFKVELDSTLYFLSFLLLLTYNVNFLVAFVSIELYWPRQADPDCIVCNDV